MIFIKDILFRHFDQLWEFVRRFRRIVIVFYCNAKEKLICTRLRFNKFHCQSLFSNFSFKSGILSSLSFFLLLFFCVFISFPLIHLFLSLLQFVYAVHGWRNFQQVNKRFSIRDILGFCQLI